MDAIKKKVLRDVFASPASLLPLVLGSSAVAASWFMGGNALLTGAGVIGIVSGVGVMANRWIFGLERLTERAFKSIAAKERRARRAELDALERKLRGDRDPRTQTYLRRLRKLYDDFQEDLNDGTVSRSARTVLVDVEKLFHAAVERLEDSYRLWDTATQMSGDARRSMNESRDEVVEEVRESVEHLSTIIEQFHTLRLKEDEGELAKLRDELNESMQAARRAEERVEAIGKRRSYTNSEIE